MIKKNVIWNVILVVLVAILVALILQYAMLNHGFYYSVENGIYKVTGWNATIGELTQGIKHYKYEMHLNIFDIIRLWNVNV